ncbi:TPA: hydrogenase nickel incorporation protein HypB [Candidatus Bathyarchaeota archaeon]|nr:hydrogenase nickel incorporation protein HypB [Candidatus Bathyarchaeota archaeon]
MEGEDTIKVEEGEMLEVEIERDLLEANERLAMVNRKILDEYGVKTIDVMGSVGSGKTSLIEAIVKRLKGKYRIAMIAGDVTTKIDADRISKYGIKTLQINTGKECHLDAMMLKRALRRLELKNLDLIFVENVGNLICPADFPLGAHERLVVISVTEGPYTVRKHPYVFMSANVVVINKVDLAEAMGVKVEALLQDVKILNRKCKVVVTSAKTGEGIESLIEAVGL